MLKFGNLNNQRISKSDIQVIDTPVTHLSKIFSKTNFTDTSNLENCDYRQTIPADIDESANLEPPTGNYTVWVDTNDYLVREYSNSSSSGYYSSTTQSAPPTCDHPRAYTTESLQTCPPLHKIKYRNENSLSLNDAKLRRTKSCFNRSWLVKRQRKHTQWPKISGISANSSKDNSIILMPIDTNSCPAVISSNIEQQQKQFMKFCLPTLGEVRSSTTSEDSPPAKQLMNFSSSSEGCSPKRPFNHSNLDNSFFPANKKQRISSPIHFTPPTQFKQVNTTLPSEDLLFGMDNLSDRPRLAQRSFFDLLRHHSTPMPPHNFASDMKPSPSSPTDYMYKPSLARSSSDPSSVLSDKHILCDNGSIYFDGQRTRALPVVDRTASGLNCVTVDTVADLITNPSHQKIIVDCRFPYEYEGGHINGAINIFTHSDLVKEIFDRVPAQRPPGSTGPPRILGQGLARRLALTRNEAFSAPCELISDEAESDDDDEPNSSDASELEIAANRFINEDQGSSEHIVLSNSEPDVTRSHSNSIDSNSQETPFVVIFHCEFSSQRAPALATFLRTVDRVSNSHRYPFLYFPEIYVMQGGYSAFYRSFPHICCPQTYVKMFNRDYRNHLRVYKRLTRRVSLACLACIRPQYNDLCELVLPVADMDSFEPKEPKLEAKTSNRPQLDNTLPVAFASPHISPHLSALSIMGNVQLSSNNGVTSSNYLLEDKENQLTKKYVSPHLGLSSDNGLNESLKSCHPSSLMDNSLNLAEVVVRVGSRVIAATLCNADPTISEVARALDQFKQRTLVHALDASKQVVRPLKRSLTTSILDIRPQRNRLPFGGTNGVLDVFDETSCSEQVTPALRRARTVARDYMTPERVYFNGLNQKCFNLTNNNSHISDTPIAVSQNNNIPKSNKGAQSSYRSLSTSSD